MSAARKVQIDPRRRAMIGKVKIAQKELAIDDGAYRAMLFRITKKASASACSEVELGRVLDELKAKGWRPKFVSGDKQTAARRRTPASADHPSAKKARALWISLHQLGVVRDASEGTLEAFAKRQLHVERLRWAEQGQVFKLIEALKAMAERAGWSQDLAGVPATKQVRLLKLRLLHAQQAKLGLPLFTALELAAVEDLDHVIAAYGRQIAEHGTRGA